MLNRAKEIEPNLSQTPVRRMNVLILDDSDVDRKRLIRLCTEAGLNFACTEVTKMADMRRALSAGKFDLVFIDHMLVAEDGLDAVNMIEADPDQTAVSIMIAGEGRLDVAVEAMRRGCSDFMLKSDLSVDNLQKSVATALERRIMALSLHEEREKRRQFELAVRRYANSCSIEMRTLLSATLRRVRKLRAYKYTDDYSRQLGELEAGIDRLWDAMPNLSEHTGLIPDQLVTPKLIERH